MAINYTGDESATQSPAAQPADGVSPIFSLPVDADDDDAAASLYQALKSAADYLDFLMQRAKYNTRAKGVLYGSDFFISDDFTGDTVDQGIWEAPVADVAFVDDTASGAMGAIRLLANVSTPTPQLIAKAGRIKFQTSSDFHFIQRCRVFASIADIDFGIISAGMVAIFRYSTLAFGNSNWHGVYGTSGISSTSQDLGVALDGSYHTFEIIRIAGTIVFAIDGTVLFSAADTSSGAASFGSLLTWGGSVTGELRIDATKLWIGR